MAIPSQAEGNLGRCRDWTGGTYSAFTGATVKGQSRPQTPPAGGAERRGGQVNPLVVGSIPTGPTWFGATASTSSPARSSRQLKPEGKPRQVPDATCR